MCLEVNCMCMSSFPKAFLGIPPTARFSQLEKVITLPMNIAVGTQANSFSKIFAPPCNSSVLALLITEYSAGVWGETDSEFSLSQVFLLVRDLT